MTVSEMSNSYLDTSLELRWEVKVGDEIYVTHINGHGTMILDEIS